MGICNACVRYFSYYFNNLKQLKADNYTPTEKDWNHIKSVMTKHNRQSGWIDVIEDNNGNSKLEFFDSNPKLNNWDAMYITKSEVEMYSAS